MGRFSWIDALKLVGRLIDPGQEIIAVKYFSSRTKTPEGKRLRQAAFLDAVATLPLPDAGVTATGHTLRRPPEWV